MADDIKVVVKAEVERALRQMGMLDKKVDQAQNSLGALSQKFSRFGSNMSKWVTLPLAGAGAAALKFAGDIESQRVALTTMLGSAEDARDIMEEWQQFAAKTPFQLDDITNAGKALIAFGEDADDVTDTMQRIGDVAAGLNIPMGELSEIYGKARVQGRLFAEDLNQLAGRGIPIFTELADVMGVTAGEVKELTAEGNVGFGELEQAFRNMTAEGGQFHGLTEELSKTFEGKLSTALSELKMSAAELGEVMLPLAKDLLDGLTEMLTKFNELDDSTKKFIVTAGGIAALTGPVAKVTGGVLKLVDSLKSAGVAAKALKLASAMGPAGLAVAGIGAAATAIGLALKPLGDKQRANRISGMAEKLSEMMKSGMSLEESMKQITDEAGKMSAIYFTTKEGAEAIRIATEEAASHAKEAIERSSKGLDDAYSKYFKDTKTAVEETTEAIKDQYSSADDLLTNSDALLQSALERRRTEEAISKALQLQKDIREGADEKRADIIERINQEYADLLGTAESFKARMFSDTPGSKMDALFGSDADIKTKIRLFKEMLGMLDMSWGAWAAASRNSTYVKRINEVREELQENIEALEASVEAEKRFREAMENRIPTQDKINDQIDSQVELLSDLEGAYERVHTVIETEPKLGLPSNEELDRIIGQFEDIADDVEKKKEMLADAAIALGGEIAVAIGTGFTDGWGAAADQISDAVKNTMISVAKQLGPGGQIFAVVLSALEELVDAIARLMHPIEMMGKDLAESLTESFSSALANDKSWEDAEKAFNKQIRKLIVDNVIKNSAFKEKVEKIATEMISLLEDGLTDAEKESFNKLKYDLQVAYEAIDQTVDVITDGILDAEAELADERIDVIEEQLDRENELRQKNLEKLERWADEELYLLRRALDNGFITMEMYQDQLDQIWEQYDAEAAANQPLDGQPDHTAVAGVPKFARGGNFITNGKIPIIVGDNPGGREHVRITPLPDNSNISSGEQLVIQINAPVYGIDDLEEKINQVAQRKNIWRRRNAPQGVR